MSDLYYISNKNRNTIQNAIDSWLDGDKEKLHQVFPILKEEYPHFAKMDNDYRSGDETYGYSSVYDDMNYISDRWTCAFRIKWMIDGIENNSI